MPTPSPGEPRPNPPPKPRAAGGPPQAPREIRPKRDEAYIPLEPEQEKPQRPPTPCPECSRLMPGDAILCTNCGFNRHTGLRRAHKAIPCRECGYDLTGVVNSTCPECNAPVRRQRSSLIDDGRTVARASYRKALMGIGIGLASLVLIVGLMGSFRAAPAAVIGTLVCWPVAIVGYALVKMFWDGLDEPWRLLALRALAALLMAAAAAALLMPTSPMGAFRVGGIARLSFMVFVVVGTLMTACEEDAEDAVAYSIPFALLGAFGPAVALAFV